MSHYASYLITAKYDTVTSSCSRSANCTIAPSGKCQQPLQWEGQGNEKDVSCSYLVVVQVHILLNQGVTADLEHVNIICMMNL